MPLPSLATEHDIIALEKSYWDAMKQKDGDRTAELSGDHALVTGAQGVRSISKDDMRKMTEEDNWSLKSYIFTDVNVCIPAPNVAIIAYTVWKNVTIDGKAQELKAAETSTWIRGDDKWECHAHSETFLDDA